MGEIGKVIGIDDNKVTVKMTRTEACAKCRACSIGMEKQDMIIKASNLCNANIDDNVEIVLEEENFIKAVSIMYGIPFISLIVGIFGGYYGSISLGVGNNELIGFCLGMLFVIITYLWIRHKESYWKSKDFVPKAIRIEKETNNINNLN